MNCFVCGKYGSFAFCEEHAPKHADVFINNKTAIFYGKMPIFIAIWLWVFNIKIIRWWTGTDSRSLIEYLPGKKLWKLRIWLHRIKTYMTEFMVSEHWYGCTQVYIELQTWFLNHTYCWYPKTYGDLPSDKLKYVEYPPLIQHPSGKDNHKGMNILVQSHATKKNRKYKDWVYGVDIIEHIERWIKGMFPGGDVRIVKVYGDDDMDRIYPIIDLYLFTKRYDNPRSRMMLECEINDIPYIVSTDTNVIKKAINEMYEAMTFHGYNA